MLFLMLVILVFTSNAQKKNTPTIPNNTVSFDQTLYSGMRWREVGPFRGGRSSTATGVRGNPNLYYFGTVGGGVWKTADAGQTYEPMTEFRRHGGCSCRCRE